MYVSMAVSTRAALAILFASAGLARAIEVRPSGCTARCDPEGGCTLECTHRPPAGRQPVAGIQLRQKPRSFLGMDLKDIHLTPEEQLEFAIDYPAMLWAGRPLGICQRLPKEFMEDHVRTDLRSARVDPVASFLAILPEGETKAAELELPANRPPKGAVAFIGSSTFTFWRKLAEDMQPWQVYNAAFGGSAINHQIDPDIFQRLVVQHEPSQIVFYCGTNDVAAAVTPEDVRDNFATWHAMVRKSLGAGVRIVYVAIVNTPMYLSWKDDPIVPKEVYKARDLMSSYCSSSSDKQLVCIDTDPLPYTKDPDFYLRDKHHMVLEGHRRLAAVIKPVLAPPAVAAPTPASA